jgi:nitric oxide synthase oxygenase domain/subunit
VEVSNRSHEIDVAVLHSFDEQGYTIVDMDTVGEQFMTHCKRGKEAGRECPTFGKGQVRLR